MKNIQYLFLSLVICGTLVSEGQSSQLTAVSSSDLNSSATTVYSTSNTTDKTKWSTVPYEDVAYGPSAGNNLTVYAYGWVIASSSLTKIYNRTLNATVLAMGLSSDTTESAVIGADTTITPSTAIPASYFASAVAPGFLALFTTGADSNKENQVYVNIYSNSQSVSSNELTATNDAAVILKSSDLVRALC